MTFTTLSGSPTYRKGTSFSFIMPIRLSFDSTAGLSIYGRDHNIFVAITIKRLKLLRLNLFYNRLFDSLPHYD